LFFALRSCKSPSFLVLLFAPPLLHSQAAREAWSMAAIRSVTLHSLQPLPSRLAQGCFSCVYALKNHPTVKKKVRAILPREINARSLNQVYWFAWMLIFIEGCQESFRVKIKFCAGHPSIKIER